MVLIGYHGDIVGYIYIYFRNRKLFWPWLRQFYVSNTAMIDYRQASGIIIEVAPCFLGWVGAVFVGFCSLLLVGTMMAIEVRLTKKKKTDGQLPKLGASLSRGEKGTWRYPYGSDHPHTPYHIAHLILTGTLALVPAHLQVTGWEPFDCWTGWRKRAHHLM